jgi:subtilisin family serine protease
MQVPRTVTRSAVVFLVAPALALALSIGGGAGARTLERGPKQVDPAPQAVPGELIVRFHEDVPEGQRVDALAHAGAREKRSLGKAGLKLATADPERLRKVLAALEDDPRVRFAEPNLRVHADLIPADPSFGQLWGLHNTGQTVDRVTGSADADIDAPEAWDVARGSKTVVVGVVDTGVDFGHPDLAAAQWVNAGEDCTGCRTDGVDNDGNGFVDDWRGWDFVNDDNNPTDDEGHGTHVAGTIGATADNGVGVAGVANVSIAALKFLDAGGSGTTADAVRAINYANAAGFPITNNSWGGGGFSQALYDAVAEADARGALFVAAAGNSSSNNDSSPHYPSNYALPNVISVAATDSRDGLASFSSYGATSVHLAAPGTSIYSTVLSSRYDWYSGTSMATPHVAGAAALAKSAHPGAGGLALKALLLRTTDAKSSLSGKTATGGRLNVNTAVRCAGAPKLWLDAPRAGFTVAVGQPVTVNALVGCGEASVTATAGGSVLALTARGDGLWTGTYVPTAAGSLTVSATAGGETRSVTGTVVDDYWQSTEPFAWIDATAGGTRLSLGDDASATVALPFGFEFYKQAFTSVKVSSNGYVVFGSSAATEYWNAAIPSTSAPNGFAAPLWDDLNPGAGGGVWHRTVGTSPNRKFVVAWVDVPHYGTSGGATFEVVLEEGTNAIVYQYRDTHFNDSITNHGASATVGLENLNGTAGKQFLYREALLQDYENATAIRYSIGAPAGPPPPPDTTPPAAPTGLTASAGGGSVSLDWADNAEGDLAGYRVYRQQADGTWAHAATVTASAYTQSGLVNGTTYTYRVTARDTSGNESAPSATASATPEGTTTVSYEPSFGVIEQGSQSDGTLGSLFANDGDRLVISRSSRVASFYAGATISTAALASLRRVTIDYDGSATTTAVSISLAVWNWRTGGWQTVDGPRAATTSDRAFTWTNTSEPHDYVSSTGEIRFRVHGERSANSSFSTRTDLIRYSVEY